MIVTLNELESAVRKAAMGAGWPYGLAEEAGRAAIWLMRRGQNGLAAMLPALPAPGQAVSEGSEVSGPVLAAGASAVDLVLAGACEVRIGAVQGLALIGLCGAAAESQAAGFEITFEGGSVARIGPGSVQLDGAVPERAAARICSLVPVPVGMTDVDLPEVSRADWAEVQRLAGLSYVAASEASRLKGAGAGLTDND